MAFFLEKAEDRRYLRLTFEGSVTIKELVQSQTALKMSLSESDGYKKALVDMRKAPSALSGIDIHQFVSTHKKELPPGFLIAVIVEPDNWAAAIFAENIAQNRGIYMRVFRDEMHAFAWLGISDEEQRTPAL